MLTINRCWSSSGGLFYFEKKNLLILFLNEMAKKCLIFVISFLDKKRSCDCLNHCCTSCSLMPVCYCWLDRRSNINEWSITWQQCYQRMPYLTKWSKTKSSLPPRPAKMFIIIDRLVQLFYWFTWELGYNM